MTGGNNISGAAQIWTAALGELLALKSPPIRTTTATQQDEGVL